MEKPTSTVGHQKTSPKQSKAKKRQQPVKVVYITNPMKFKASSASEFRALVQELTGKDSDVADNLAKYNSNLHSASSVDTTDGYHDHQAFEKIANSDGLDYQGEVQDPLETFDVAFEKFPCFVATFMDDHHDAFGNRDIVGSAYYIAPEVLKRNYGPEVDIWSIGVMLYILLCGVPPFWAESEHGIFKAILEGPIDLNSDPWPNISDGAKDLVEKMLCKDPQKRLTAFQVLNHPWIKEDGEAPDTPLDNAVLNRLKQFRAMNQFKKAALRVIAGCLSEEEIRGLKEMFKAMDTDNSGTITLEELKQGLSEQGTKLSEYEVKQLMEAADADGNGAIDYEEFITATVHLNRMDREEHLFTAFQYFDKDNSGFITREELEQALKEKGLYDGEEIKEIIAEADADNDGRIDYNEFVAMMRKGNPEANPKKRRDIEF